MRDESSLPDGWIIEPLGEISSAIQYGYTAKSSQEPVGPRLLRITDIQNDSVEWSGVPFCKIEEKDKSKYLLEGNDFVFARTGATVGKSYLIRGNIPESVFASYLIRVRLQRSVVDPRYVAYFFKSLDYWQQITENQAGIGQPNVNGKKLAQLQIPIAPLEQQKRIVAEIEKQFSRLDEAVANLKRVKANLKRYKAAVLKAAVEGKLTEEWRKQHPDVEPADKLLERILEERRANWQGRGKYKSPAAPGTAGLPELPDGWVWARVEQLSVLVQYGSSAKTSEDPSGIPVLRMGNIVDGVLDWGALKYLPVNHDEFPTLFLKPGDLLFNRTNSPELVGKTAVYTGAKEPCSFASYLIRVRTSANYLSPLLSHYINSPYGRQWVKSVVTQQVGQANVNGTKLQELAVPVPPLNEQQHIVAEVERRLSIVAGAEAQVEANLCRAERLRQSILKQAFSGKL